MGHEYSLPLPAERLDALESRLGYRFRDRRLLCRALTHSSYSNELGRRDHHLLCNERLEFLGDSILSLVVSEYLFFAYEDQPEGILTCLRKDVVCADALADFAREIQLGDYLLLGVGEERTGGRDKVNILADAFEALLAAVYVDAGRNGQAKDIIAAFLLPFVKKALQDMESRGGDWDYKTPLQQFIQQTEGDVLEYVLVHEEGPDHMKTFEVEARLNSNVIGRGVGRSKRKAEQAAAQDALSLFGVK